MSDEVETYLRVLEGVATAEQFVSLLDEDVAMDARGTDNLWTCNSNTDLGELGRRAYESGVRVDILESPWSAIA
jgi:hypothetical protein